MTVKRKAETLTKRRGVTTAPAKKKSGGKKTTSAGRPAAKTARGSKTAPEKKAVLKKTAMKKPVGKKPAAIKSAEKTKAKVEKKADRLEELRKTLIRKREEIVREAKDEISKYISGENRQLVDTALDEGDWAVVDISEDINLRRLDAHRKALHDIDESLRKIKEGTYGICEECGEEISEKRLHVLPTATLCVNCKENREQLEALEKEETL